MELLVASLNAATLIVVAIIQVTNTKTKKQEEERYKRRLQHERLTMDLIKCDFKLSVLTAKKFSGEHINGDLEKAIDVAEQSFNAYSDFAINEVASSVSKL